VRRGPASLISILAALALSPAAHGVLPKAGSSLQAHEHGTHGHDWHVALEVNHSSTRLASVVLYAQECGLTDYAQGIPLTRDGSFAVDRPTWSVHGRFLTRDRAAGTWSVTKGTCVTGERAWDTHDEHEHSHHIIRGNPAEYPPAAITGSSRNAKRLRALMRASLATKGRFDTLAKARRRGYVLDPNQRIWPHPCPGTWHMRKHGVSMWGKLLDPKAPQSLVWWCDSQSRWHLAAYMYRAEGDSKPGTYGDLLQWHKHGEGRGPTWMTHVWMVPDPHGAFATCAPFPTFARFSIFRYEPYTPDVHVDAPCSDSDPLAGQDARLHG
jgi:hypothetical protein